MSARAETAAWLVQRASAAVLAICVTAHIATVVYAVRGGLTAAEILGRTRGSAAWLAFYALFVAAVAIHAPLGLRAILREWVGAAGRGVDLALALFALALAAAGWRAVAAVTL